MDFVAASIKIQSRFASHEFEHGGISRVDERALEINLRLAIGILHQCLDGVRRFPQVLCHEMVTDAGGDFRWIEIEVPMSDIDIMDHEVGEDAAAKIPKPTPIPKAILIERLVRRVAEKLLPVDGLRIDAQ